MNDMNTMQKLLCDSSTTPFYILKKMCFASHIFYFSENGIPVIAFMADEYFVMRNNQLQHFTHSDEQGYLLSDCSIETAQLPELLSACTLTDLTITAGFISYDASKNLTSGSQKNNQPSVFIGIFNTYLKQTENGWLFISHAPDAEKKYAELTDLLHSSSDLSENHFQMKNPCIPRWNKTDYVSAFDKVQEYIKAGDCYQINLTQEFTAKTEGLLLNTAEQLWQLTDAPYEGYIRFDDFELLSCSPELFIEFQQDRKLITKPIKGTTPRYDDPEADEQSKLRLINSIKDQAENVMIVDLLRNDLSVYAETGSVKTPKLFNIESFNQVHHMVSEVTATLKPTVSPWQVLMMALPGGSITGAPKIRAMEIIEELEGAPRGAYCGSMGYFNADGTGSWNILIRSVQQSQNELSVWAGGGITIASGADAEYQECFDKVSAILDLLNTWHQPEKPQEKSES